MNFYDPENPRAAYSVYTPHPPPPPLGPHNKVFSVQDLYQICKECIVAACQDSNRHEASFSQVMDRFLAWNQDHTTVCVTIDREFVTLLLDRLKNTGGVVEKKSSKLRK